MHNQRWNAGRDSYRPAGEVIRTAAYDVAPIASDTVAKSFVCRHHYSATYPAARFRFGLFEAGELVGVAVFSHPCNDRVLTNCFPAIEVAALVELGRFVLLDRVPGNGETWFLARCFEQLRGQVAGVVSFSDPVPRRTAVGALVFPGHVGTIYQAHNATYLGRATARTLRVLPDGTILSARAIAKLPARDQGWRYTTELLRRYGAPRPGRDLRAWAAEWVPALTRPLRHRGNHRYAWGLDKSARRSLPASLPYPKMEIRPCPAN
jgi:hypothetical protein